MSSKPWVSGPREILQHAINLMSSGKQADYRIAFLIIDNAVELTVKTWLSLPERITHIKVSKNEFDENSTSFPGLIKLLEAKAPEKLVDIDLSEIEWYHRLRNQLYHQGNGLTIEPDKVEKYLEFAKSLFYQLLGFKGYTAKESGERFC
jgi:hypothetical protein